MRLEIYELALLDASSADSSIPLLQTCSQISMEAQSTLYKRPTSFSSQAKLFAWIERSQQKDLKRVRTLTLRLTDIDLSSILEQPSNPADKSRPSVWTLYQTELERLDDACKALPKLSSLTILPPKSGRSQLAKGLYHSFLALIPSRLPQLSHLELQDGDEVLDALPALRSCGADVKCTGSSSRSTTSSRKGSQSDLRKDDDSLVVDEMEGVVPIKTERNSWSPVESPSTVPPRAKVHKAISRRKPKSGAC